MDMYNQTLIYGSSDMIDMTKIEIKLERASDNYAYINLNGQSLQLGWPSSTTRHVSVNEYGIVELDPKHDERERNRKIATLQCNIQKLQRDLDCIRNND